MAVVIKPKRIGCCGTPCFISRKSRMSVGGKAPRNVVKLTGEGNTADQPDLFLATTPSSPDTQQFCRTSSILKAQSNSKTSRQLGDAPRLSKRNDLLAYLRHASPRCPHHTPPHS